MDDIRAAAVAEVKSEILAELENLCRQVTATLSPPAIFQSISANPPSKEEIESIVVETSGTLVAVPPGATFEIHGLESVASQLQRIAWLVGLSDAERAFVSAAAEQSEGADYGGLIDTLLVFSDWLVDMGMQSQSVEVRKVVPNDGDVLIITQKYMTPSRRKEIVECVAQPLVDAMANRGRNVFCVVADGSTSIESLDAEEMRRQGWVRASDVKAIQYASQEDLAAMLRDQG